MYIQTNKQIKGAVKKYLPPVPDMTYNVFSGTLNTTQSVNLPPSGLEVITSPKLQERYIMKFNIGV